jgi:hypothetical protein
VLSALGTRSARPTTLFSESTHNIISVMNKHGVRCLVCITSEVQHAREGSEPKRSSLCFVVPLRLCGPPATKLDHRMFSTR